jgi:hypothetical protein
MVPTSPPETAPVITEEELDDLATRGYALYNERLKSLLEPEHNGETVAIHLDSGDYALGRNASRALESLWRRRPEGMTVTILIGPPKEDPTLVRMLADQVLRAQSK